MANAATNTARSKTDKMSQDESQPGSGYIGSCRDATRGEPGMNIMPMAVCFEEEDEPEMKN